MTEKLLAFSIPGSGSITLPGQIQNIANGVAKSPFGSNIVWWAMNMAFVAAGVTALIYFIYAGFRWIMSGGDPKNIESARTQIIYAAVGLGVVLLSAGIVNVAASFFCIPLLGFVPANCPK